MDIFAPSNLPGVGMGDLFSVVGMGAMLGLAITAGAMLAEGLLGTLVYVVSAVLVLLQKPDLGGRPVLVSAILAIVVLGEVGRILSARRGSIALQATEGEPTTPTTAPQLRVSGFAIAATTAAGAAVGFAFAEWNEVPFSIDVESWVGIVAGTIVALIGADAARSFIQGAVRAGGHGATVGATVVIVSLALNSGSFYVPFFGYAVLALGLVLSVRQRRREQRTYKGLRMLR